MGMIALKIRVGIPFAVAVDLNETDSSLDEPAGHQTLGTDILRDLMVQAIKRARFFWFIGEIDQVTDLHLHSIGEFETLDTRQQIRFAFVLFQVVSINLMKKIQLGALIVARDMRRASQIQNGRSRRAKESALITGWQKPGTPVERSTFDPLAVAQHDI